MSAIQDNISAAVEQAGAVMLQHLESPANPAAHRATTAAALSGAQGGWSRLMCGKRASWARAIVRVMPHRSLSCVYGRGASRGALLVCGALLGLSSGGCASVIGEQEADANFLVAPKADASFFGWSEITIQEDASSVDGATLRAVTVEVLEPPSVTDMSFLQGMLGEIVTSKERVKAVEKKSMPPGERVVPLDILYTGDLRGFFEDGHTVRIEWSGHTSPSFTAWPPDGIWVRAHVIVSVE